MSFVFDETGSRPPSSPVGLIVRVKRRTRGERRGSAAAAAMNLFRSRVDVFEAINKGDWQKVKDNVVQGKANARDSQYDATLLHWAVNEGHMPTVEHLLACGADVRLRDGKHSATPLHWASAKGHVFVVRLLMMQESDVNSRDASYRTPLHWAAGNGQLGVIRELMFWGARVECTDVWKKVPLHWAAFRGHVASVEELVGKGSPVDQPDADGNIPGSVFHHSVQEEARKHIRAAIKRGPASGDGVVRAATVSSELLLETLQACRSWGELFENRHFDVLSKECQEHRERLRGVIQGLADQGKAEELEPCFKAMDLLNSALELHEGMRSGTKPVPLGGAAGRLGSRGSGSFAPGGGGGGGGGGGFSSDGCDRRGTVDSGGGGGPPRAGGEHRGSADLQDFLSTKGAGSGVAGVGDGAGASAGAAPSLAHDGSSSAASLRLYPLPVVEEACGGFDPKRCIGEGGFGKVYRGSMMGLPVAVKKLDETGLQGREQFFREVEVLSTCRHENIVPLLGVCMEPPCLVYRLMPNNSLRHHLDDQTLRSRLGWRLRVRTTLHMCNGLAYLHSESTNKPKVIHGDIKPENILLDEYLKARLADFGISRVGESEAGVFAQPRRSSAGRRGSDGRGGGLAERDDASLQGTFGYMDPVYQSTGRLDEKSDVFSLGVVMLELLTGDPVHCPEKTPPGLVDRVRKALEERSLKGVVDRSAVWSKTAAKAYARLACGCCAENPEARPTLREVSEKVRAIQETGQRNSADGAAAAAAETGPGSDPLPLLLETPSSVVGSNQYSSIQRAPGDDLLGLFDHAQSRKATCNVNGAAAVAATAGGTGNGPTPRAAPGGGGKTTAQPAAAQHRHHTPKRQPSPPPPPPPLRPHDVAIQGSLSTRERPPLPGRPPTYHEIMAAQHESGPLIAIDGDGGGDARQGGAHSGARSDGGGELVDLGEGLSRQASGGGGGGGGVSLGSSLAYTSSMAGAKEQWWEQLAAGGGGKSAMMGPGGMGGGGGSSTAGALGESGRGEGGELAIGSSKSGSISCTRSTALAEYGAGLPGVLRAVKGGGGLSSNPRLLCVCNDSTAASAGGRNSSSPPGAQQESAGHVSVLDLWYRGRTVKYAEPADRAAMSPNKLESVIALLSGGSLQVLSIPRRCKLQEQAVTTDLCMWRWLHPWGLALVTDNAVFYWNVSGNPAEGNSPEHDSARGGSTDSGGDVLDGDQAGRAAQERDAAVRARRPRQAFPRQRTLTPPNTLHRVYDYQASADGKWGLLLCAVVDNDWGRVGAGAVGNGYGSHSSGIEGGGGPVKVDLHSFERGKTFEFEVLGASLMTMPGSRPVLNLLGLVVRGEGGATEFRALDLDRSLSQAEGPEDLERLADRRVGWLIATTHVIADEDLGGSAAFRVVDIEGGEGCAEGSAGETPLVSPPVFLRQWTANTNVVFVVGCHGLLLVLDVVTGAELARAQACAPPLVEAEVDPDVGELVVISTADGGGFHQVGVRPAALRASVEYDHKDAEMAARVSVLSGYGSARSLPTLRR